MKINDAKRCIKELRVRFWYEGLRQVLHANSPWEIERKFNRPALHRESDVLCISNSWRRYREGRSLPRKSSVRRFDVWIQQLNGPAESNSSSELYNVLWDILLLEKINHTRLKKFTEKAGDSLRVNIERWWHAEVNQTRQRPWVRISRSLVHMGSMDGLAGLVLIWVYYYQVENYFAICDIAEAIYRSMLVVGISFRTRGLDKEFFDLFIMRVFNLIAWRDSMCLLDYNLFYTSLDIIEYSMKKMKNEESADAYLLNKNRISPRREFFKIVFQFDLPIFPVWGEGPPTKLQWIGYVEKKYNWFKKFITIREAYLVSA